MSSFRDQPGDERAETRPHQPHHGADVGQNTNGDADWSGYFREKLAEERAKNAELTETIRDLHYLAGYYGRGAELSGNAGLAELVGKMTEALDGTWARPGVLRTS
jgi:hypothetical protein